MPFYQRGDARIHYEETGSGFPILLMAPGAMNSAIDSWTRLGPFDPMAAFGNDFRVIAMDQRHAGESTGPFESENPWDSFVADQLGVLDHLGIERAFLMGCCIGCSYILRAIKNAPERVVAGILIQPIGLHPTEGNLMSLNGASWGKQMMERDPSITQSKVDSFIENMWLSPSDFVFSVTKDFVRSCQTPMLVLPGIDRAHPHEVGIEVAQLAPRSELVDPWKEPPELLTPTIEKIRSYLQSHTPIPATA